MTEQKFYEEVKNNWIKIIPKLRLPSNYFMCEIDNYFYVFAKKEDKEYAENILRGELSSYYSMSLLCVSGIPYNEGSRLLILIASKTIMHWQNNSTLRNSALQAAFGHLSKGVDSMEYFHDFMPNRYGLILNEKVNK